MSDDIYEDAAEPLFWLEPTDDEIAALNATLDADAGLSEEFD